MKKVVCVHHKHREMFTLVTAQYGLLEDGSVVTEIHLRQDASTGLNLSNKTSSKIIASHQDKHPLS